MSIWVGQTSTVNRSPQTDAAYGFVDLPCRIRDVVNHQRIFPAVRRSLRKVKHRTRLSPTAEGGR